MKDFDAQVKCEKCKWGNIVMEYVDAQTAYTVNGKAFPEYLKCRCARCGFRFDMKTHIETPTVPTNFRDWNPSKERTQ